MATAFGVKFKPKSILGMIIAAGVVFLLLAGLSTGFDEAHAFFLKWGKGLLLFGGGVWLLYIIPGIKRAWGA